MAAIDTDAQRWLAKHVGSDYLLVLAVYNETHDQIKCWIALRRCSERQTL